MSAHRHAVLFLVISITLWPCSALMMPDPWMVVALPLAVTTDVVLSMVTFGVFDGFSATKCVWFGCGRRLIDTGVVGPIDWHGDAVAKKIDAKIHKFAHDHLEKIENMMTPMGKKESIENHTPLEVENAVTISVENYVETNLKQIIELVEKNQKKMGVQSHENQNKMEMLGGDDQMAKQVNVEPETVKNVWGKSPIGLLAMMISGMLTVVGVTLLATRSSLRQMIWPPASEVVDEEMQEVLQ